MQPQALTDVYSSSVIAVTGGTGFIGSRLLRQLSQCSPKTLRVLVRKSSSLDLIADLDLAVFEAPLDDEDALDRALEGVDYVFHLAGLTRAKSKSTLMAANEAGTGNLARSVARVAPNLKRFLHVSSQAAMGPNPEGRSAVLEGDSPGPVTWYGESKLASEEALVGTLDTVPWSIVRPPGVYGPGEKDFLSMFRMVNSRFAPMIGFQPKSYSLVYSEDLVAGILAVACAENAIGQTYFVADPEIYTTRDLLLAIEDALGKKAWKPRLPETLVLGLAAVNSLVAPLLPKPPILNLQKVKELLPNRWVVGTAKLQEDVGYVCPTSLKDGIRETARWYQEKGWL